MLWMTLPELRAWSGEVTSDEAEAALHTTLSLDRQLAPLRD